MLALAAVLVIAAPARAEPHEPAGSAPVAEAVVGDPDEIRDYWTPGRMRAAEPAGLGLAASGRVTGAPPGAAAAPSAGPKGVPASRAAVDASAASARFPERVHGKVFFTISGGTQPGDYRLLGHRRGLQRAHARLDRRPLRQRRPSSAAASPPTGPSCPAFATASGPFGTWPARELFTTEGWGERRQHPPGPRRRAARPRRAGARDRGRARRSRDRLQRIADARTSPPSAIRRSRTRSRCRRASTSTASGCGRAPRRSPARDNPPGSGPATMQIDCDMTGGSSGGCWVTGGGRVNGVTSYGYASDGNHLYGPYLGDGRRAASTTTPPDGGSSARGREVTNLGGPGADDFERHHRRRRVQAPGRGRPRRGRGRRRRAPAAAAAATGSPATTATTSCAAATATTC